MKKLLEFIAELIALALFFIMEKLLDLIRLFAHAKRRWARENKFLEKVGLVFIKKWFQAMWKIGRWVFGIDVKVEDWQDEKSKRRRWSKKEKIMLGIMVATVVLLSIGWIVALFLGKVALPF